MFYNLIFKSVAVLCSNRRPTSFFLWCCAIFVIHQKLKNQLGTVHKRRLDFETIFLYKNVVFIPRPPRRRGILWTGPCYVVYFYWINYGYTNARNLFLIGLTIMVLGQMCYIRIRSKNRRMINILEYPKILRNV